MTTFQVGSVPEHFNYPWHKAIEEGAFEEAGIKVEWHDMPGGTGAMTQALNNGDLDIAIALTEGITADIIKGGEERILQFHVNSPLRWGIHVPANSSFQAVEELEGKRFAISRYGSGSHLMAHVNAHEMGWDPNGIEWVVVSSLDGAREAFKNGEADAFMWEKFTTQFLVDNGEFRRVGTCDTPWPCFVIAARTAVIEKAPQALRSLLAVINNSNASVQKDPENWRTIAHRYDLDPEKAREWAGMTEWATSSEVSGRTLEKVTATLHELGIVPREEAPEKLCSSLTKLS